MAVKSSDMCSGCGVCAVVCPKKCIEIKLNEDGFYRPIVDASKCVECGVCEKYCNAYIENKFVEPIDVASAVLKDKKQLNTVSSGGVCYAIAKNAIEKNIKVCGVIYDYDEHIAKHIIVENIEDLEKIKGSKYFQSYTVDGFMDIFNGDKYLVFGTPCQIASIAKVAEAKNIREKLILVDFFCHGTPSMLVWRKYICEQGNKDIEKIDFRSKEFGWHNFSFKFTYSDGSTSSDSKKNMFYRMFFNNLCLNDSCYRCQYKAWKSMADIRTGDYWGDKYKENSTGVSCCVTYTQQGKEVIEDLKDICDFECEDLSDMLLSQMNENPRFNKRLRNKLLKALKGKCTLQRIENTVLFLHRVKSKLSRK